jgi:hypothetical protein
VHCFAIGLVRYIFGSIPLQLFPFFFLDRFMMHMVCVSPIGIQVNVPLVLDCLCCNVCCNLFFYVYSVNQYQGQTWESQCKRWSLYSTNSRHKENSKGVFKCIQKIEHVHSKDSFIYRLLCITLNVLPSRLIHTQIYILNKHIGICAKTVSQTRKHQLVLDYHIQYSYLESIQSSCTRCRLSLSLCTLKYIVFFYSPWLHLYLVSICV